MTTFTTEDRQRAWITNDEAKKLVEEAPYHPGYEDAVIVKSGYEEETPLSKEIDELFKYKERHINTSKKIIDFLKSGCVWER